MIHGSEIKFVLFVAVLMVIFISLTGCIVGQVQMATEQQKCAELYPDQGFIAI
jgi:hypothetical protein